MPHRTVFQWGKNHAHPFTTFIGGLIIGVLVTGAVALAWAMANGTNVEFQNSLVHPSKKVKTEKSSPAASVKPSPTTSPVSF